MTEPVISPDVAALERGTRAAFRVGADATRRAQENRDPDTAVYLIVCAALTGGCESSALFKAPRGIDVYELDREVPEDRHVDDLLRGAGWRLDHGQWVCGKHEQQEARRD